MLELGSRPSRIAATNSRSWSSMPLALAFSPAEVAARYLQDKAVLHRYTSYTITEPAQLSRALASTRQSGTGFSHEEMTLGVVSVASPIVGDDGQVTAARSNNAGTVSVMTTTTWRRYPPPRRRAGPG